MKGIICSRCSKRLPSAVEQRALDKLRRMDLERWAVLSDRLCRCAPRESPMFTSSVQPLDLQMYDKILR